MNEHPANTNKNEPIIIKIFFDLLSLMSIPCLSPFSFFILFLSYYQHLRNILATALVANDRSSIFVQIRLDSPRSPISLPHSPQFAHQESSAPHFAETQHHIFVSYFSILFIESFVSTFIRPSHNLCLSVSLCSYNFFLFRFSFVSVRG